MTFEDTYLPNQPIMRKAFDVLQRVACANDPLIADSDYAKKELEKGVKFAQYVLKHGWSSAPDVLAAALIKHLKATEIEHYMQADVSELTNPRVAQIYASAKWIEQGAPLGVIGRSPITLVQAAHVQALEEWNGYFCAIKDRSYLKEAFKGSANTPWLVKRNVDDHAAALQGAESALKQIFAENAELASNRTSLVINTAKRIRAPEFCA